MVSPAEQAEPGGGGRAGAEELAELYSRLRRVNERQGYYFNRNRSLVDDLLSGLLLNKSRYGYMACPCRLASGSRSADRDITCPCEYRAADVAEYGTCYCNLYVTSAWNEENRPEESIPERRPADRFPI